MKIAALCASAGRHSALERSLGFFLAQTDKTSKLIIFENSEVYQELTSSLSDEDKDRIILYNQHIDSQTGKPYTSVGAIWADALRVVPKDIDAIAIWNDDDYYLPNHIEEGIKGLSRALMSDKVAYKPKKSIAMYEGFKFDENTFESSIFVTKEHLLKYGFSLTDGDYDLQWVNPLLESNTILIDPNGPSTMIYDWGGDIPVYKVSGDMNNPDNFKNIRKGNNDFGDKIITPSDPTMYYNQKDLLSLLNKAEEPVKSTKRKVLEIGVSHNSRESYNDDYYICIDETFQKGVDLQVPIYEFEHKEIYDIIITTNTLKEDHLFAHSIKNIAANLKVGGRFEYNGEIDYEKIIKAFPNGFFKDNYLYPGKYTTNFVGIKSEVSRDYNEDDLVFITAQPEDRFFAWEIEVQINNLRKYGLSNRLKVLVYWERREDKKSINTDWLELHHNYPEVEFFFVKEDLENTASVDKHTYSSIIRPYCLEQYWKYNPDMEKKVVFYMDSDVIFTKMPNIPELIKSQNCFVTNTESYLGVGYMKNKAQEVGLDQNHFIDIAAEIVGISRDVILSNDRDCGGAQYVLKNIPQGFWDKVQHDAILIKRRFAEENQKYFRELGAARDDRSVENAGIQSWCADMWAVLYNLYYYNLPVKSPNMMISPWASDPIKAGEVGQRYYGSFILHNTGVEGSKNQFDKTNYRWHRKYMNLFPWTEDLSYVSPDYYSKFYADEITNTIKNRKINGIQ